MALVFDFGKLLYLGKYKGIKKSSECTLKFLKTTILILSSEDKTLVFTIIMPNNGISRS